MTDTNLTLTRRAALTAGAAATTLAAVPGLVRAQASIEGTPTALITGCSTGIGRDSALRFAREGWHVIATMREVDGRNAEAAASLMAEADGLRLDVVEIDVDFDESVSNGVAAAADLTGGRIDLLVNNAGIMVPGPMELVTQDLMHRIYNTNLYGQQRMVRAVAPLMRARQHGIIMNISSGLGVISLPVVGLYASTKHAMEAWSDAMKHELIPYGIDVVAVQPSDTDTPFLENARRYYAEEMTRLDPESEPFQAYARYLPIVEASLVYRNPVPVSVVTDAMFDLVMTNEGARPNRVSLGAEPFGQINMIRDAVRGNVVANSPFTDWVSL